MGASKTKKGLEGGHRSATPFEPEHELVKVGLQVLALDPVVRTAQPRLEVPEHLMGAGEDDLGAFWPALCLKGKRDKIYLGNLVHLSRPPDVSPGGGSGSQVFFWMKMV